MAPQLDQYHSTRIVQEDLRYLDEFCRARKYRELPQQLVYYGPQVFTVRMPAAASNHTAQFYGGAEAGEPTITSNKAAEQYGGVMINDYYRGRSTTVASVSNV